MRGWCSVCLSMRTGVVYGKVGWTWCKGSGVRDYTVTTDGMEWSWDDAYTPRRSGQLVLFPAKGTSVAMYMGGMSYWVLTRDGKEREEKDYMCIVYVSIMRDTDSTYPLLPGTVKGVSRITERRGESRR